jgi:hypothetical protein
MSKIDVDKLEITPALYEVCERLPPETIPKLFQPLLEILLAKESEPIYRRAMNICAWIRFSKFNFYVGRDQFKTFMKRDAVVFPDDLIPEAIFQRYWELAKNKKLWLQKYILDKHIPYDDALKVWKEEHADDIEAFRKDLQIWLISQES